MLERVETMYDLIMKAKKCARGAGQIQEGQRRASEKVEFASRWIGWLSVVLSAVVGTSIFAEWIKVYQIPFGLAAIIAAALGALQRASKLDERAEDHRVVAAEYGGLRRRADMLRLRLEAGDVARDKGLSELNQIGEDLSILAKRARPLPDRIYELAKESFKKTHQEYYSSPPTHAGGIVFRKIEDTLQFLVVQALSETNEWVLPKGHIEPGESPEQAARREVLEEAGIHAVICNTLDTVEYVAPKGLVKGRFFLMESIKEGTPIEGREKKWLSFDDAVQRLQFKEAQQLICQAYSMIRSDTNNTINS